MSLPKEGLEPSLPCGNGILNPARLPIPPLRRLVLQRRLLARGFLCVLNPPASNGWVWYAHGATA